MTKSHVRFSGVRGAEAPDTQIGLAVELADCGEGRLDGHASNLRWFGLEFSRVFHGLLRRRQQPGRVEDEHQLRDDMNASGEQRIEESERGEEDAERVDANRAGEVLR